MVRWVYVSNEPELYACKNAAQEEEVVLRMAQTQAEGNIEESEPLD
jgi:hypothetical protein